MAFRAKKIFLADDNDQFRLNLKDALTMLGHNVVIEAFDGDDARKKVLLASQFNVEVAVLDCHMPDSKDGPEIAGLLNAQNPWLLVVSVSSNWQGVWLDPNFDREHPHPNNAKYDINGRGKHKGPDHYITWQGWNLKKLSEAIGELEFNIKNPKTLEVLETDFNSARRK